MAHQISGIDQNSRAKGNAQRLVVARRDPIRWEVQHQPLCIRVDAVGHYLDERLAHLEFEQRRFGLGRNVQAIEPNLRIAAKFRPNVIGKKDVSARWHRNYTTGRERICENGHLAYGAVGQRQ